MSGRASALVLALAAVGIGGCAETAQCNKPKTYQQAKVGKHVEIPEGLDALNEDKELTIPKASPQAPPPPGACLDMPPTLRTDSSEG